MPVLKKQEIKRIPLALPQRTGALKNTSSVSFTLVTGSTETVLAAVAQRAAAASTPAVLTGLAPAQKPPDFCLNTAGVILT